MFQYRDNVIRIYYPQKYNVCIANEMFNTNNLVSRIPIKCKNL